MFEQMGSEKKEHVQNSIGRIAFTALCVLIQIGWLVLWVIRLNEYSATISIITSILAFSLALRIYGKHENAAFKMPWIILLLIFPIMGLCLYGLFGHTDLIGKNMQRRFERLDDELFPLITQKEAVL